MRRATAISAAIWWGLCIVGLTAAPSCKSRGGRYPGATGRGGAGAVAAGAAGHANGGTSGAGGTSGTGETLGTGGTSEADGWTRVPATGPCALEVADVARVATVP